MNFNAWTNILCFVTGCELKIVKHNWFYNSMIISPTFRGWRLLSTTLAIPQYSGFLPETVDLFQFIHRIVDQIAVRNK